jgi:hypothetical protein
MGKTMDECIKESYNMFGREDFLLDFAANYVVLLHCLVKKGIVSPDELMDSSEELGVVHDSKN